MPFNFIPFNKGGLIGPALLGARLSPSFLPPPSSEYGLLLCPYIIPLVHIAYPFGVVRILNLFQ